MIKLNIGCGYDIKEGWVNIDIIKNSGIDKIMDLNKFPYDFKDDSIDEILFSAILEHLDHPKEVIDELCRICKPNGKIIIYVPHFSNWQAWGDITHKRTFNSTSLDHIRHNQKQHNLLDKNNLRFIVKPYIQMGRIFRNLGIEKLINLHNATRCFYERNLSQIFPAIGIKWILIKL